MLLNIGVIGAGGFAQFAVNEFIKIPDVNLKGIYDENQDSATRLQQLDSSAKIYSSLQDICDEPSIDLVYIATPPFLHYEQSKAALLANKHVICEKPAAIKLADAVELQKLAESRDLLFVVNLMQRYNPLYESVAKLIERKILGDFLRGFFENYASDEALHEQHWFWDKKKSGGIFIEHGVHFFDMFSGWLGNGKVVASQKLNRPDHKNIFDRFHATVLYAGGLVNFYHGFDQPKAMDRQEMRLLFERGEITLTEWVPTQLKMTALCDDKSLSDLKKLFPGAKINLLEETKQLTICHGRFKEINYKYKISLSTPDSVQKQDLYKYLVTQMFTDQRDWIRNRSHQRKIDHNNAVNSLKIAEEADLSAVAVTR